jgi:hemerythrin
MAIEWTEEYATGNAEVDAQHRRLFDLLNSLEQRINKGEPPAEMVDVFDGLAAYAKEHFAFEERCMEQCACSAAGVNKLAHQRFLRMVGSSLQDLRLQEPTLKVFKSLHWELTDWLRNHICKIDTSLRATS